jgi:hypothetical protein
MCTGLWEQYPTWTLEQMAQFVADGVEATQLLLTPSHTSASGNRSFCW